MMQNFIDNILSPKINETEEFFINLFEYCNLKCAFCWQDHNDKTGIDSIPEKSDLIIQKIKSSNTSKVLLNIMGGELFFDEIDNSLFNDYFLFAKEIHDYAILHGVDVTFNWVTNFVYTKTDRVQDFLKRQRLQGINTILTTSYDPTGRFNKNNLKLFLKNIELFKTEIRSISVVLTKPNIKKILQDDPILDFICENYITYFDFYSPEKNYKVMHATDKDILEFFHYALKKYPHSYPLNDWIMNKQNKMSCRRSHVLTPHGVLGKCGLQVSEELKDKFKNTLKIQDNSKIETNFIEKYSCLSCEFYQQCSLGCFLQHDFNGFNELQSCMMKEIFTLIKYKKEDHQCSAQTV